MKASNSAIQCFKSCRRMYELKYIYGLEPVHASDAIERGVGYHEAVEHILMGDSFDCDDPKVKAMATAFKKHIMPHLPRVEAVEEWFEYRTPSGHKVIGRIDGRTESGAVVEHKTTSSAIDGVYFQRLEMDEQIPTYLLAENANSMFYTVCQTPTIRQKKSESNDEFCERCVDWYDSGGRAEVIVLTRSDKDLLKFIAEQDAVLCEMSNCRTYYKNPNHCMKWGRLCEYAPICMQYDPSREYIQFKKREATYGN